jgi:hypothetical protein
MLAATPSLPFDFVPTGQFGILLTPMELSKSLSTAFRCLEKQTESRCYRHEQ